MFPVFDLNASFHNYGAVLRSRSRAFFGRSRSRTFLIWTITTHSKSFEAYDEKMLSGESEPTGFQKPGADQKRTFLATLI